MIALGKMSSTLVGILKPSPCGHACVSANRSICGSAAVFAGFQGYQGQTMGMVQRQNMMERKKRLIKKLENTPLELKPIKDFYIRYTWRLPERKRELPQLTAEELERRILLQKEWGKHVAKSKRNDEERILRLMQSQEKALYELRQESEDLYLAAITCDERLFPFTQQGPSETAPFQEYKAPLGTNIKWEDTFD